MEFLRIMVFLIVDEVCEEYGFDIIWVFDLEE